MKIYVATQIFCKFPHKSLPNSHHGDTTWLHLSNVLSNDQLPDPCSVTHQEAITHKYTMCSYNILLSSTSVPRRHHHHHNTHPSPPPPSPAPSLLIKPAREMKTTRQVISPHLLSSQPCRSSSSFIPPTPPSSFPSTRTIA